MKTMLFLLISIFSFQLLSAQGVVGKWKKISHVSEYEGQKFDSHIALLKSRPCAEKVVWEINADGTFRLNAKSSGCDESYRNVQEKLWAKTKWKLEGNKFTTSATNFAVGQSYTVSFKGNKMIMTGIDGQGVITYQRL